jgi:hypothetical protein
VFRAYDSARERLVAVKLFKLDLPPERGHQLVAEFERLIAANLSHPAVAAPLATGISGVSAFLAQDYVAADSLDLAVREYGPAPAGDALRVAAHLAGALDFAAAVQVTHGALHPRDVLLSSDDTRLTGLGIARALERIGVVAPVRRPYTAPERIAGGDWDRRADVFSLAALMHELMWGRRVSGLGAQAAESLTAIVGTDLAALRSVFARALAEKPGDRFETALEFAEALKNACPDVAVALEPAPAPKARGGREEEPRLPLLDPLSLEVEPGERRPASASREADEPVVVEAAPPPLASGDAGERRRGAPTREKREAGRPAESAVEQPFSPAEQPEDMRVPSARDPDALDLDIAAPPIVEPEIVLHTPEAYDEPAAVSAGLITGHDPDAETALGRTRSAVWPLVLALVVGIAIGFAGGFFAGSREQPSAVATTAAGTTPAPGREFTEVAAAPAATAAAAPTSAVGSQKSEGDVPKAESRKAEPPARKSEPPNLKSEISNLKSQGTTGRLLVRSTPAGAEVSVDGKDYGRTPATVRDLSQGAHRLTITRPGYTPEERRFVITPSRPAPSMTIALAPARTTAPPPRAAAPGAAAGFAGGLAVDSRPAGAKVFVDGKLVGTTPMVLPSVSAGSHAIRLERDGYQRWSSSVRVVASEQNRVTASLER